MCSRLRALNQYFLCKMLNPNGKMQKNLRRIRQSRQRKAAAKMQMPLEAVYYLYIIYSARGGRANISLAILKTERFIL